MESLTFVVLARAEAAHVGQGPSVNLAAGS
jgi:hypothetical protein